MQNLYEYRDYRQYLKDVFAAEKKVSHLTLTNFAKRLGMSPSLLKMVMEGQRKLTNDKICSVAKVLKLSTSEWSYFESLVRLCDAESDDEKFFYGQRLDQVSQEREQLQTIRTARAEVLGEWFLPALLVYLIDHAEAKKGVIEFDKDRVRRRLGLSSAELDELIDKLQATGLLKLQGEGNVQIVFDRVLGNLNKQNYLLGVLSQMRQAIKTGFKSPESNFYEASVVPLNAAQLAEFKKDYLELIGRYTAQKSEKSSRVTQLFLGAFPAI